MRLQRGVRSFLLGCGVAWLSVVSAFASPYHGQVTFNGLPLPGSVVTVTATQGDKKVVAVSDDQGLFGFADLADGNWALDIEMTGFAPLKATIAVAPALPVATFEMKLLTLEEMRSAAKPVVVDATAPVVATAVNPASTPVSDARPGAPAGGKAAPAAGAAAKTTQTAGAGGAAGGPAPAAEPAQDATSAQANDGFLINGSVNNAATSQFSLNQAFGNNRGSRWRYNGGLSLVLNDSVLNARTFSLNGAQTPKEPYTNIVAGAQIGGPMEIPHLIPLAKAPYFYAGYQRTQNKNDSVATVKMPTQAQQLGDLTGEGAVYDPNTGKLFGNTGCEGGLAALDAAPTACIPANEISSVAQGLLKYYPFPNSPTGASQYNYQVAVASDTHTDSYQFRLQKQLGSKNNINGTVSVSDSRSSTPNQNGFGFLDTSKSLNTSVNVGWYHRFTQRLSMNAGYNFSISKNNNYGYFASRNINASGLAGISGNASAGGNDQAPAYYGPPSLSFASQIATLSDGTNNSSRPETNSVSLSMSWNRFRHNMTFGGDFRRQEWNTLSQSNPKGSLYFSGLATEGLPPCPPGTSPCPGPTGGNDFADFLLGRPDTSSIAYGNADKYLRQSAYDLFADDDFRVNPELSIRAGVRWEFGAPVTEIKNRLVNLDVAPGFTAVAPVLGTNPKGSVSGQTYPSALMRPDHSFPEPRVGIAWRPISGSSLLVRAGYGIYNDTSVYQATARAMAQQAPLSTSLQVTATNPVVSPTAACPFTIALATPFIAPSNCPQNSLDSFAVDPNFRVGYAQQWQLSVQRDLPFSLQMVATYTGIKGTRGVQEFAPNSYAPGTTDPYGTAPANFYYRTSNGNSTREAGMFQLRRRLRNGFTANMTYTFSKSLDDDLSLGGQGPVVTSGGSQQVAQDWKNPAGNRGLSTFDQRNVLAASLQYTTGMGIGGSTLLSGWRGLIYKEWTVQLNINEASGTPLTPITTLVLPGTSFSGVVRANYAGGAIHGYYPNNVFLNQSAFTIPTSGFGNARRDSITGPSQFGLNASLDRTWRLHDRYNVEARVDANNVLNHVAYSSWNTTVVPLVPGEPDLYGTPTGANGMRSLTITLRGRF